MTCKYVISPQFRGVTFGTFYSENTNLWIFRSAKDTFAWSPTQKKIVWQTPVANDEGLPYRPLIGFDNITVTTYYPDANPKDTHLVGINTASGDILWKHIVDWGVSRYLGGVQKLNGQIAYIAGKETNTFFFLNPKNGKVDTQYLLDLAPQNGNSSNDKIYYSRYGRWLHSISLADVSSGGTRIWDLDTGYIEAIDSNIYTIARFKNDQKTTCAVWLNSSNGEILGKLPVFGNALPKFISIYGLSSSSPNLLLVVPRRNQGLSLIDFKQNKVVWHIGKNSKMHTKSVINTPYGFVALTVENRKGKAVLLDKKSGTVLEEIKTEKPQTNQLFWINKHLIIDTYFGPQFFLWESS